MSRMTETKKYSVVEMECQNTSESEDDNLEKNYRASKIEKIEEASWSIL